MYRLTTLSGLVSMSTGNPGYRELGAGRNHPHRELGGNLHISVRQHLELDEDRGSARVDDSVASWQHLVGSALRYLPAIDTLDVRLLDRQGRRIDDDRQTGYGDLVRRCRHRSRCKLLGE